MKKILTTAILALLVSGTAISCKKKPTDQDLQVEATSVVVSNPNAKVEIKDGVAHLSGEFQDQASKDQMVAALKEIKGIQSVMDMTHVAEPPGPIQTTNVSAEDNLQKVNDALKDYPKVKATIKNDTLTLTGDVTREQARQIKESIDALQIGKYYNDLIVE